MRVHLPIKLWDGQFRKYISDLKRRKTTIVCGDFNVANEDIDVRGGNGEMSHLGS